MTALMLVSALLMQDVVYRCSVTTQTIAGINLYSLVASDVLTCIGPTQRLAVRDLKIADKAILSRRT